jgi:hypothetical protein
MNLQQLNARLRQLGVVPKDAFRASLYLDYLNNAQTYFNVTLAGVAPNGLGNNYPFVRDALRSADLLQQLADILDFYVAPAVDADLIRAYTPLPNGLGHGGAQGWRYADYFNNVILDANNATYQANVLAFMQRYPTTQFALNHLSTNFQTNIFEACGRIIDDQQRLTTFYADLYEDNFTINKLKKIKSTGSDFHKGGKQVLILTFEVYHEMQSDAPPLPYYPTIEELKVVYKPSDLEADCLIIGNSAAVNRVIPNFMVASLVEIYNQRLQTLQSAGQVLTGVPLNTYRILPRNYLSPAGVPPLPLRNAYGYLEYLNYDLSGTAVQIRGYYPFIGWKELLRH